METILQEILDIAGVGAALVFDGGGRLVAHRGRAVYDRALCEQVSALLVKAVDSVQLQQEDWDSITALFADGRLLLRNLGAGGGTPRVLAVVADATLNASFATVAIRVAAGKLKRAIDGGGNASSMAPAPAASSPGASGASGAAPAAALGASRATPPPLPTPAPAAADSRPGLAGSGLAWSKISSVGLSSVSVADPASAAFLTRASRELARYVGPISKVFVEEAVRRISSDAPFSLPLGRALVDELAAQVEDPKDRALFVQALGKP